MSLKIRRGTNAERLTIIPAEGELIYTTDTKNLYIGDASTSGGKFITGVGYTGSKGIGYTGSSGIGLTGYTGSSGFFGETVVIGANNQGTLAVTSNVANSIQLKLSNFNDSATGITSLYSRGRGIRAAKLRLEDNDTVARLAFISEKMSGYDSVAYIDVKVNGTTSNGIVPGSFVFGVTGTTGNTDTALSINSNRATTIYGGFNTSVDDAVSNGTNISLIKVSSSFIINGSYTSTLPNGVDGQIKTLIAKQVTSGSMTITVTTPGWSGAGTIVLNTKGQGCILQWVSGAWYCVGNNGALIS